MTPAQFRKIRALDQASLYARQSRTMSQEAYVRDTNIERRRKLDEAMAALQAYEHMVDGALDQAYERVVANQTATSST